MKLWDTLKKLNKASLMPEGYFVSNVLVRFGIALIFFWLVLAAIDTPRLGYYVECKGSVNHLGSGLLGCANPFYNANCDILKAEDKWLCSEERLLPGFKLGEKPSFFYSYAGDFAFLIIVIVLLVNHFIYNRRKKNGVADSRKE